MKIDIIYNRIKKKLESKEFLDIVKELEHSSDAAATSSEALLLIGNYLNDLEVSNPEIFEFLKPDIEEYLEYCKAQGLIPN